MLVEIDHVRLQPAQRRLDRAEDVLAGAAALCAVAHRLPPLRREHDPLASPLQRTADQLFAPALAAVDVRGVEERDAGVDRGVDHRERRVLVDTAAEVVAPEADDGNLERPERAHEHPPNLAI